MSKLNEQLEDKYAKKAVSFKAEPIAKSSQPSDGLQGLSSEIEQMKKQEQENKPKGILQRKAERIFGAATDVRKKFFQGFQMGFLVGGIFGGLMGTYYAIVYRQFMYIPMSALGSGGSFGFFMGIGMIMRSEMEGTESSS